MIKINTKINGTTFITVVAMKYKCLACAIRTTTTATTPTTTKVWAFKDTSSKQPTPQTYVVTLLLGYESLWGYVWNSTWWETLVFPCCRPRRSATTIQGTSLISRWWLDNTPCRSPLLFESAHVDAGPCARPRESRNTTNGVVPIRVSLSLQIHWLCKWFKKTNKYVRPLE